jgi:hypothetical protein
MGSTYTIGFREFWAVRILGRDGGMDVENVGLANETLGAGTALRPEHPAVWCSQYLICLLFIICFLFAYLFINKLIPQIENNGQGWGDGC